jgi:hypothetical protein
VTSTAVAAARRAEIDAIVSSDPMISLMQSERLVDVVADTRTPEGTETVYGGPYPGPIPAPSWRRRLRPISSQRIVAPIVRPS